MSHGELRTNSASVLKQEKMSPMNPLSIIWYMACVRTSARV
jgi:hypothetical protein